MRKDWIRKICLILCLVLCLSGSAMASEGKAAMGRYVEVPLDISGGDWVAFAHANGTIYAVDGSGEKLLKSLDLNKNNWDYLETGHDEQTSPALGGVNGIAVGADGTLYLSSGWAMWNEEGYPYIERIKDGKAERVQLDRKLGTSTDRLPLCVLPSGDLMGLNYTEAYRFSPDGKTQQKYPASNGESMAVHGNEIAVCSPQNSLITILDIESGQTLRTLPLPTAASYGLVGYDAEGALYYVCPDGMYQVDASSEIIQIADGRLMSVGKPSVEALQLLFDSENNPIIAYGQGGGMSLIAYHYDENVATEPGTMLNVFTLYDNATLRECANKFQQRYPDVMVDIIVALPEGTAITRDDAIRTLNTELLAGKGPDVLVLDGLPVQGYLDKGVLQDLSSMVQPMIDSGELLSGIVGAFKLGDAIPAVPTRFLMPSIWGEVEGLNTLEAMANWAQANPDALPLYSVDIEPLIGTFYPSCAPAWFTEDGWLDEAKIEAFLTALQAIRGQWTYEAMVQRIGWDIKERYRQDGRTFAWNWNPYQQPWGNPTIEEYMGCERMVEGTQEQLPFLLRGLDNTTWPNGVLAYLKRGNFAPLPGQAEGCFVPMLLLGASKGAANGDTALKFIEYSLGEESQNTDLSDGFQVNVKALDAAQARDHALFGLIGGGDWWTTWLDPGQHKQLREIIDALKTPVIPDFTLYQMIVQESTPFFEGKIDAKQAAANVCAKANAYLSE